MVTKKAKRKTSYVGIETPRGVVLVTLREYNKKWKRIYGVPKKIIKK